MNTTKTIESTALDATTAYGTKGLIRETADLRISTNKKSSTKPSIPIKVLGISNRTTIDANRMGISQVSAERLSTTSRRMTASYHTTQRLKKASAPLAKRMTMDLKSFNKKSCEKTAPGDNSKIVFPKPHKISDKLPCHQCGMTFFYKTSLAAHIKSHATQNSCKHCGRNFALPAALSKHLRENCSKISVAERKKLLESDAKLDKQKTPVRSPRLNRATDELLDLVFTSYSPSSGLDRLKAVPFKDFVPITGIARTPRKLIKCSECGHKFKNPLQFAIHAEHCVAPEVEFKLTKM